MRLTRFLVGNGAVFNRSAQDGMSYACRRRLEKGMNVWVRVASGVRCGSDCTERNYGTVEVDSELSLTIYHSKQQAEKAQSIAGGVVLEVNAACLKPLADQSEFGNEVTLTSESSDDAKGASPSEVYISVSYAGLPYKMVPNYGGYKPGTVEPQGDIAEFGPEAEVWLSELEKETGFDMRQ